MAVARVNFLSKELGISTNITVILPSFDQNSDLGKPLREVYDSGKKYPVLWLLHGGSGDDADYLNWTNIARYAVEYDCAVVCRKAAGEHYGLCLLKENIEDRGDNETFFYLISL